MGDFDVTSDFDDGAQQKPANTPQMPKRNNNKNGKKTEIIVIVVGLIFSLCVLGAVFGDDETETNNDQNSTTVSSEKEVEKKNEGKKEKASNNAGEIKKKAKAEKKKTKVTKKQFIDACKTYKYKDVLRKPKKYVGKKVKVKVKISQVHERGIINREKYYFAYTNSGYGMWLGNEYAIIDKRSKKNPKLLEDDIIEVYGTIAEPEETTSLIVSSSEVFTINMKYAKLIKG